MNREPRAMENIDKNLLISSGAKIKLIILFGFILILLIPISLFTFTTKQQQSSLDAIQFVSPQYGVFSEGALLDEVSGLAGSSNYPSGTQVINGWNQFVSENGNRWTLWIDKRSGIPSFCEGSGVPWVPGEGNTLTNSSISNYLNAYGEVDLNSLVSISLDFLYHNSSLLPIDCNSLVLNQTASGNYGDYLWYVTFNYTHNGILVEGSEVFFRVNHGNLVQFGTENIAPITLDTTPYITQESAQAILGNYIGGYLPDDIFLNSGELSIIPIAPAGDVNNYSGVIGQGIGYRLVYTLVLRRQNATGTWLAKIDAHTGEILLFTDDNKYGTIRGGVYPVANLPGTEAVHPFANMAVTMDGNTVYTNRGGYYNYLAGQTATATLDGKYVETYDTCGEVTTPPLSGTLGDIDFKTGSGTDCATPGVGGDGNTHASRTSYFHLDAVKQKARAWLPSNQWLNQPLIANVNLDIGEACSAFWDGESVNYYKSGGGCSNTGELSGAIMHETGHGLDTFDGGPSHKLGTGEAYGDTVAILSTHSSCIGSNLHPGSPCSGYGDNCTTCTGIRDVDYAKHVSGTPATPSNFIQPNCADSTAGECNREGHCVSYVISEAVWDLASSDLINMGIDDNTAWEITERLFYLSRPAAGRAFSCPSFSTSHGCNSDSWFSTFRVVDDDNGNLSDGTPHANAIFKAFNRHHIKCGNQSDPANQNYTICPTLTQPTLAATFGPGKVKLSWQSISNAVGYRVFRNEISAHAGYITIKNVSSPAPLTATTTYTDTEVASGITYYYTVQAVGFNPSCLSPLANPVSVTPIFSTYNISGYIGLSSSTPEPGVTVTADPAWGVTDGNGNFLISDLPGGGMEYIIIPSKTCRVFTPSYSKIMINNTDRIQNFLTYQSLTGCDLCSQTLEQNLVKCGSDFTCQATAFLKYKICLEKATLNANSEINGAELLSINFARQTGQPTTENFTFTVGHEGDYFVNLVNGDSVDLNTRVSSAVIDLNPGGSIFRPNDFNKNIHLLVKPIHLLPGDYTLSVELRSQPDSFVTIVVSDRDFSLLPELP